MINSRLHFLIAIASVTLSATALSAGAQEKQTSAFMNPNLPPEQRAADIVHQMTLEEKASQLVNQSRAIPRLDIPLTTGGARLSME